MSECQYCLGLEDTINNKNKEIKELKEVLTTISKWETPYKAIVDRAELEQKLHEAIVRSLRVLKNE